MSAYSCATSLTQARFWMLGEKQVVASYDLFFWQRQFARVCFLLFHSLQGGFPDQLAEKTFGHVDRGKTSLLRAVRPIG